MTKEQLKQIRQQLGLTQKQLAEIVGRNLRTIQRQESGEWTVGKEVAEKVKKLMQSVKKRHKAGVTPCHHPPTTKPQGQYREGV
jgi:transcriptional regulator with XRE-family HTH domain